MTAEGDLLDESALLRRSIEDLDREYAAGDVEPGVYEALRARYASRASDVAERLARREAEASAVPTEAADTGQSALAVPGVTEALADRLLSEPDGTAAPRDGTTRMRGGSRAGRLISWSTSHRRRVGWAAVACLAVAATVLALALAGVEPFSSPPSTLSVAARIRIELAEAAVLASNHDVAQAIALYDDVLAISPHQPEALADGGWLTRLAGLSSHSATIARSGDREIALAVSLAPGYALARAYDGVARLEDAHDPHGAVAEFRAMLADHPSSTLLSSVRAPALRAFRSAGQAVPAPLADQAAAPAG